MRELAGDRVPNVPRLAVNLVLGSVHDQGVTGILVYGDGVFLQAIEGGRQAISDLYGTIQRDARHRDVVLLDYEEITQRRFGGWSMGLVNASKLNANVLLKYSDRAVLDPYSVSGRVSLALLEELIDTASIVGRS